MKRGQVIEAFRLINGIKMNVVSDKETRKAIISNHLQMYKVAEAHDNEVKEVYKKLFDGKEEDVAKVNELRQEFNTSETTIERKNEIVKDIIENYRHVIELETEFNTTIAARLDEEVDINLVKFNKDEFTNACADSNLEFTMLDILRIEDIFNEDEDKALGDSKKE